MKETKNEITELKSTLESENIMVDTVENQIHGIKTNLKSKGQRREENIN